MMLDVNERCGRPTYAAPFGIDETPVCLMHSRDPQKSDSEFQQEFERILREATDRNEVADFTRFFFTSAEYTHREFKTRCRFDHATFTQRSDFSKVTFTQHAIFSDARFTQKASFYCAAFIQIAYFYHVTFTQAADFCRARFMQDANFSHATFAQVADFLGTEFTQEANFEEATFAREVRFDQAKFLVSAAFRETVFRGDKELGSETDDTLQGPVFSLAQFSHPEAIVFYKTYLGQALFLNCDVSGVTFSSVTWRKRNRGGKSMVLEEEVSLDCAAASALKPGGDSHDELNYGLIAQIYQQLKKNYDSHLDYWTANEFHFSEMEMKRLAAPTSGPLLKIRRWCHRYMSFIALYRYASDYGNNYTKPILWLLGILLLFATLFPLPGLQHTNPTYTDTYASAWHSRKTTPAKLTSETRLIFGKSLLTAIDTAMFQKSPEYSPAWPWGRLLAILEISLTSTLFGLFLLAIRRQFRR